MPENEKPSQEKHFPAQPVRQLVPNVDKNLRSQMPITTSAYHLFRLEHSGNVWEKSECGKQPVAKRSLPSSCRPEWH